MRWWTVSDLADRLLLPRDRVRPAVRSGALPVTVCGSTLANDDDVLIDLRALDWWLAEERYPAPSWVHEWQRMRQTPPWERQPTSKEER